MDHSQGGAMAQFSLESAPGNAPSELHAAAITVCDMARDTADATHLLDVLGLVDA